MHNPRQAAVDRLRSHNIRATIARRAVLETLIDGTGHLTADDISEQLKRLYPEVHLSTVYRTLDTLEAAGVVDHVHLGHGRAVYHLTDNLHQHLVCERCGNVMQVPDELFDSLALDVQTRYGFQLRRNHFAVLGTCRACIASGSSPTTGVGSHHPSA
ncbi:MAG: Fur family transcriptional regulator [Acidimicrobiales bacterium]